MQTHVDLWLEWGGSRYKGGWEKCFHFFLLCPLRGGVPFIADKLHQLPAPALSPANLLQGWNGLLMMSWRPQGGEERSEGVTWVVNTGSSSRGVGGDEALEADSLALQNTQVPEKCQRVNLVTDNDRPSSQVLESSGYVQSAHSLPVTQTKHN